ncbi:hypothetical protein FAF40_01590 [Staphylococcus haemolyticus]|uniref:hypothetical protein n=1 Tax=Staphylococcus haemolyticus TaxID=1283 RepID=UPI0010ABB14D|nr:hypothetical protein [Staphylococcus haemolyticus]HCV2365103.1 hypothetical protein [Staphylococcus aureus]MCH4441703.1 hypothetical protein [Staphylococcus haemolyticus]TJX74039.1 hypothetical protein FAF40_01590 [Staphylococcus haemolyticus]HCV6078414.1 hypothetical protein [Staphylococcus aureus]HDF1966520.1 hypothetical protein [Staphylococcus aureus]
MKISFEKDTPEEKAKKKAEKKAKRKERYGHLAQADEGSLAKFISNRFKKNDDTTKKKFFDDKDDLSFLKEAEDGSAVKYTQDLFKRMFPDKKAKNDAKNENEERTSTQDNQQSK